MCCHFVVKLCEATEMFMMVDCVRQMTVTKSCKYGEYGWFECLLFLFYVLHAILPLDNRTG